MKHKISRLLPAVLLLCSACGFEGFLGRAAGQNHPTPDGGTAPQPVPAVVTGIIVSATIPELSPADLEFLGGDGSPLTPGVTVAGEQFTATFPSGQRYLGMVVAARRGTVAVRALVPLADPGNTTAAGDFDGIDNRETAACLLVQGKASSSGRAVGSFPAGTLQSALTDVNTLSTNIGPVKTFFDMVQAISACSGCNRGTAVRFRSPVLTASGLTIQSALHPDFILANPIDYDGDGKAEDTTDKFDTAMKAALLAFKFKACYCDEQDYFATCGFDKPMIQVVFAVSFNPGQKDGNCDTIDRFRWAQDKDGARMFFAAGIHPDSTIQDNAINQLLGAWAPNQVAMVDDGTHGDEKAGDGIWTVTFTLPVGLKMGYKYTWGRQGDNWGGTEEWPGNRRLLAVADVNGDHFVARFDNFGDETTNKDQDNMLLPANGGTGTVTWDTDANKDGIPDTRERMVDTDGDCKLDTWWTPTGVLPLTTNCP